MQPRSRATLTTAALALITALTACGTDSGPGDTPEPSFTAVDRATAETAAQEAETTLSGSEDAAAVPRGESALQAGPGEIAVDGTMLKLTGDEAVNRVGFFYAQPGATYYFFKLDKPTQITGAQGPGTRTATVEWLYFGGAESPTDGGGPDQVVGKHARLIIDKTQFTYSTEPGFPELSPKVGHATNYEILN